MSEQENQNLPAENSAEYYREALEKEKQKNCYEMFYL